MPVYVDGLRSCLPSGRWNWAWSCHMFARPDNVDALHDLAAKIGLKREWFQSQAKMPHYDLSPSMRAVAVQHHAIEVGPRMLRSVLREWRSGEVPNA